jgi:hypothetical protein
VNVNDLVDALQEIQRAGQGELEVVDDNDHPVLDVEVSADADEGMLPAVVVNFASYQVGE